MEKHVFYYADLDLTVELEGKDGGFIDALTHNERMALQQQLYLSISSFLTTRALYYADKEQKAGG